MALDSPREGPAASPAEPGGLGAVIGRYSLEREPGRGGMEIAFLARSVAPDRPVAIKALAPAGRRADRARSRTACDR